ncbi:hypothetical protein PN435_17215 [Nodularia spumigena CS-590/02]|nr:hypothetical protein [Nodularia spumigena CS-590/01A]MDB9327874.1 hypothetical protein [Nodularia spumigena CS-590/02]
MLIKYANALFKWSAITPKCLVNKEIALSILTKNALLSVECDRLILKRALTKSDR